MSDLRAVVSFQPDQFGTIADAIVDFPDGEVCLPFARKWLAAMQKLYPGSVAKGLETYCEDTQAWVLL